MEVVIDVGEKMGGFEAGMEEEIENGKEVFPPLGRQLGDEEEKGGRHGVAAEEGPEWLLASDIAKRDEES